MIDLKAFRKMNSLTQIDLANFFGVGQGFISQIEKGDRPIPKEYISRLLANPHGWKTSLISAENQQESHPREDRNEDASLTDRLLNIIEEQKKDIQMLLSMLREKDEKIDELRRELDARKKETAQSADRSSAADAV